MISSGLQATILLISDQDEVQATCAKELRLHGYQVLTAANRSEAEAFGRHLRLEHLNRAILDLPQVREGEILMQRWGAQAPHLPFILISDDPMPGWLDPPVVWWLVKPLTLDILLMAVHDILGS
jgi:DNA-binding NtrC family response regulator